MKNTKIGCEEAVEYASVAQDLRHSRSYFVLPLGLHDCFFEKLSHHNVMLRSASNDRSLFSYAYRDYVPSYITVVEVASVRPHVHCDMIYAAVCKLLNLFTMFLRQ